MKLTKKDIPYFARIIGVLLVITMCVAALLSLVNEITKDTIAKNEAEKTAQAVKGLFKNAASPVTEDLQFSFDSEDYQALYKVTDGDVTVGYYVSVAPAGFKGAVNMLVGIGTDGKVCGIQILSHSETVGIGDKIEEEGFLSTLVGRENGVTYKKGSDGSDGYADGISGATYSSKAVIAGVDTALKAYNSFVGGAA